MFLQEGVSSRPQAFLVRTFTDISQKRKEKEDRVHGWRETECTNTVRSLAE